MVRRVAEEIELDIVELGVDGRLVRLQLDELMGGVEDDRRLVIKDYFHEDSGWHVEEALDALADLGTEDLLDLKGVGAALHLPHGSRSEEHTSELQSLMRISYAVFCLKKKKMTPEHKRTVTMKSENN